MSPKALCIITGYAWAKWATVTSFFSHFLSIVLSSISTFYQVLWLFLLLYKHTYSQARTQFESTLWHAAISGYFMAISQQIQHLIRSLSIVFIIGIHNSKGSRCSFNKDREFGGYFRMVFSMILSLLSCNIQAIKKTEKFEKIKKFEKFF